MDKQILIDTEGLNGYKLEIPADRMMTESKLNENFKKINEELKKVSQGSSKSDKLTWMIDSYPIENMFYNYVMDEYCDFMSSGEIEVIKQRMSESSNQWQESDMARDYDTPVNKWELSQPSKEKRLKNRNKRKSKK